MKTELLMLGVCVLLSAPPSFAEGQTASIKVTPPEQVSIFQVALRCPAAPAIGCGSAAKPILLQLEGDSGVSEAWLNRAGTSIAVVWKAAPKRKDRRRVESVLKEEKGTEVKGAARERVVADFVSGKGWYRGVDVDRLSEEEAGVIAARWVRRVQAKTTLNKENAEGLRGALIEGLKKCLTGKAAMPESEEERALELRKVASPFLDEAQLKILGEAAGCGARAMPNEE